jgi:type II secretory pathway component PulF
MNCFLAQAWVDSLVSTLRDLWDALQDRIGPLGAVGGWILCFLLPLAALCWVAYYLLSLPMRRRERARIFLDVIETGLRRGHSPERTIKAAADTCDPALGVRFQFLAAYLEDGLRLDEALDKVPRLLPPQIAATLKTGLELGNLESVLPSCRRPLKDTLSQTHSALNFLIVMVFMVLPIFPFMCWQVQAWLLPRFVEIFKDMLPEVPYPSWWSMELFSRLVYVQVGLMLLLQAMLLCYIVGPRWKGWLNNRFAALADRVAWRLPWRRKRLQRDFCAMLAMLLDAGLPEARALRMAAASTASTLLAGRAEKVCQSLAAGTPLPQAIHLLDDSGELRWRLANAARSQKGFMEALAGWTEALGARAFQQEQVAAQVFTSSLVLWNGFMVGLLGVSVFTALTTLIRGCALW